MDLIGSLHLSLRTEFGAARFAAHPRGRKTWKNPHIFV